MPFGTSARSSRAIAYPADDVTICHGRSRIPLPAAHRIEGRHMADSIDLPAPLDPVDPVDPERREAGPAPGFELVRPYVSAMLDQEPSRSLSASPAITPDPPEPHTVEFARLPSTDDDDTDVASGGRWRAHAVPMGVVLAVVVVMTVLVSLFIVSSRSPAVAIPAGSVPVHYPSIPTPADPSSSASPSVAPVTAAAGTHRSVSTHAPAHRGSPSSSPAPSTSATSALVTASAIPSAPPSSAPARPAATGTIVGVGGLCVDDNGAVSPNGNKIQMYDCNGTVAQAWTWEPDGTLRVVGKCMRSSGTAAGSLIELWDCDGSPGEVWHGTRHSGIVDADSNLCLDDPGASTTDGTQLDLATCVFTPGQQWQMQP
jgi:hypothetical protein